MGIKKLLTMAVFLTAGGLAQSAWGQTDVTSTYLTNADFSQGTPVSVGVCTYDYDMVKNGTEYCQLVPVEGWNIAENGNGRAGGLFAFGSGAWLGGVGYDAPATNSDGETTGNILGVIGVWDAVAQYTQNVTLPAGTYTLVVPVYNSVGGTTAVQKNLIGFIADGGTEHLSSTKSYPIGTWKYDFITFTLSEETIGKISLGYDAPNAGSGGNQHLFISAISLFSGEVDAEAYAAAKEAERNAKELALNKAKLEGSCYMTPSTDLLVNGSFDTANKGWTLTNMGYQQNGERPTRYAEKWSDKALSGSGSAIQTIKNLPAGAYRLTAVVNAQLQSNQSLEITGVTLKVNDETINISGPWKDYEILYNHENDGDVTVTFTFNGTNANWVCVDQFSLVYGGDYDTYISDKAVLQYKKALGDAIAAANSFINNEKNVGTNVFQKSASAFGSYKAAVDEAQKVYDADGVVQEGYESAIAALENALETYKAVELNAPAAGTRYNVVLSYDGWEWNNMAITFKHDDRNDAGKYNIQYLVEPNPNYAQAIIFTKAEGVNRYTMSVMDVDGDQRYICTGVPHGGNTSQIRTTTTASDALVVEIRATNVEGKFNIYNTAANNYIGSQDVGVFTVNNHIDFNIGVAKQAEVALNIPAGKYATAMFPFKPELPEGVEAYSCNKMNGDVLVLEEVTEPKANVPYILRNTNATDVSETVSGYGTAKQDEYTFGYLTASYATKGNYATGSYILQTQNGRQAFYLVVEEAPVPLTQYRASLNVPAPGAKAFFFGGDVTGINGVEGAEGATEVVRYNAAGVQVSTPVKGLNIIKMSDGTVKKVMVK